MTVLVMAQLLMTVLVMAQPSTVVTASFNPFPPWLAPSAALPGGNGLMGPMGKWSKWANGAYGLMELMG